MKRLINQQYELITFYFSSVHFDGEYHSIRMIFGSIPIHRGWVWLGTIFANIPVHKSWVGLNVLDLWRWALWWLFNSMCSCDVALCGPSGELHRAPNSTSSRMAWFHQNAPFFSIFFRSLWIKMLRCCLLLIYQNLKFILIRVTLQLDWHQQMGHGLL